MKMSTLRENIQENYSVAIETKAFENLESFDINSVRKKFIRLNNK